MSLTALAWGALIVGVVALLLILTGVALVALASRLGDALLEAWKGHKL